MLSGSLKGVVSQTLCKKKGGGRVAALEMLVVTPAVANLMREGKTFQIPSIMQTQSARHADAQRRLARSGEEQAIEPEEAYSCAVDKKEIANTLTRAGFRGPWSSIAEVPA